MGLLGHKAEITPKNKNTQNFEQERRIGVQLIFDLPYQNQIITRNLPHPWAADLSTFDGKLQLLDKKMFFYSQNFKNFQK